MELKAFERAAKRLREVIHQTAVISTYSFSVAADCEMYLKLENQQKTGSFKVRGAYNKIARLIESGETPAAVIASSAGNHAQGVAYAAESSGIPATIVMPRTAPMAKVSATRGYGAQVVQHGDVYDDAYEHALILQKESGAVFIPAFDDEDIIAGQGTVGLEILRELPTADAVLVPCGGGGLLAGVAACIKQVNPRVKVVGVQAKGADAVCRSFFQKEWVGTDEAVTIADGIAVKSPGGRTVELINRYVDDMVTVSDSDIAGTILLLLERCKQVVEPAGAAALAAACAGAINGIQGKRVVCVLSGGNIDVSFIHRIVERGLVQRGRRMQLRTVLPDVPGSLQKFCNVVTKAGANILMIQHDRLGTMLQLGETALHLACELDSPEHGAALIAALKESGYMVEQA